MKQVDKAWLAGIIDGEGCITLCPNSNGRGTGYVSVSVGMTHRTCYYWTVRCRLALTVLMEVLPYLVTKKKQAILALQYGKLMMPIGQRVPARNQQQRQTIVRRWRSLNKRGR